MEQKNFWQLGTWRRIPVSMHWTVLIGFAWLYLFFWDLLATAIAFATFCVLLVAHELGHVAVLRLKKVPVQSIELFGIHGRTSHQWTSPADEILIAWSGVGMQLLILLAALVAAALLAPFESPVLWTIAGPVLFVLIRVNVFLMIVALLPIGPFDGHAAWAVIPHLRKAMRRRRQLARDAKLFPENHLPPEKRRQLEESSTKAAAELMEKLGKTGHDRKEDV